VKHFDLDDLVQYESLNALCGSKLGEGIHRTVFRSRFNARHVVKVAQNDDGIRANVEEMETWGRIRWVEAVRPYFAECIYLSGYGTVLVQMYIPSVPKGKYKIPTFLTDIKPDNFGLMEVEGKSQIVCRDYGGHLLREKGMSIKLVNWEVT
jgi:hypothetical protein